MFEKKPGTENLSSTESFTPLTSALDGAIDFCSSDIISGWVCDTSRPDQPITIDIYRDDNLLITSIPADQVRPDLKATFGSNTAHGFKLKLTDYIDDHNLNKLNIFVVGTYIHIPGSPVNINKSDPAALPVITSHSHPNAAIRAHIDSVTSVSITGWALFTHDPSYPCVLSLRSGELTLCKAVANKFRRDLVKNGIGNGRHGFSIPLTPSLRPFLDGPLHIYEDFTGLPVTRQPLSIPLATENEGLQFDPRNKIFAESGIPDPVRPQYNDALCIMRTASPRRLKAAKYCVAMIASRNYIPYAKVLERSFVEHHPEFAVTILIPDGTRDDFKFFPNAEVCLMEDIGLSDWEWYAAKFSASEFCNALKPAFLKYLSQFYDRAIYLDTDIAVFSPLTEMIDLLERAPNDLNRFGIPKSAGI
ncbi:MAG: hypothetical protein P4M09_08860 [Devosia sp.]|nr:hypothetical protein [Devosia sp.]